ncbi:MAG: trypsin-like peptidase domain-containing protein, partial [Actinomycetota bacterium]
PATTTGKITIKPHAQNMDEVVAVAKKVTPSVVNISANTTMSDQFHNNVPAESLGSGVIFNADGYIITNNHVVEGAKEIVVTIGNDDMTAQLVGGDQETDIAVIKVDKKNLPAAEFGSSKGLKVGQLAVAVGSPYGFEHSVTSGVVSGLNRTVTDEQSGGQTYTNLIQTDASINPGNSGGALADDLGKVIGINTLIYSPSGASAGLGFAIPIETAKSVANQIIEKGTVTHPYIGIRGQTVDEELTAQYSLPVDKGAIIVEVVKDGPADKAGLLKDDIIVTFNGEKVEDMPGLVAAIRNRDIGTQVKIGYYRGKDLKEAEITLADKPKS